MKKETANSAAAAADDFAVLEPEPVKVDIVMNLAPASGGAISHAGMTYVHGGKYKVSPEIARDLTEISNRGWAHEASLHESENKSRRTQRAYL